MKELSSYVTIGNHRPIFVNAVDSWQPGTVTIELQCADQITDIKTRKNQSEVCVVLHSDVGEFAVIYLSGNTTKVGHVAFTVDGDMMYQYTINLSE